MDEPVDRFISRRPGAYYLEARKNLEWSDREDPGTTRIKIRVYAITRDRNDKERALTIGTFVHTVLNPDIDTDVTTFHRNLRRYLYRNFSGVPNKDTSITLRFYPAGRKGAKYLKTVREAWI